MLRVTNRRNNEQALWNRVTVVGCGLVGGSFALALRQSGACSRIAGWDSSPDTLDQALKLGVIDEMDQALASGSLSSSDLIYLAMPVGAIKEFLRARGPSIKLGAIITDAGSTKLEVCRAARAHLPEGRRFIGGHPVAGSHLSGIENARADLFTDRPYILVTDEAGDESAPALAALKETLELIGAHIYFMRADEHDRALALVSHLPQLISSALAVTVAEQTDHRRLSELTGAGYNDMTRLAASSWSVWRDIFSSNSEEIALALNALVEKLSAVRDELRSHGAGGEPCELSLLKVLFEKPAPTTTESLCEPEE